MTQTEHLAKIRAKCVELLAIAEKRTQGMHGNIYRPDLLVESNGAAVAGWKSTIAAIDLILKLDFETGQTAKTIIAAWLEDLL